MSLKDGRRLWENMRGRFEKSELPPTKTAAQRGRLRHAAQKGDLAAQQALAEYAADRQARLKAELDAAREASGDA